MPTRRPGTPPSISRCSATGRSINDGWVAATTPATIPWEAGTGTPPDVITGYKLGTLPRRRGSRPSSTISAATMPDKLKEMQDLFYAEAAKYEVLPLDNSTLARFVSPRPNLTAGRKVFTYSGELSGTPNSGAPNMLNKSYTITAEVEIPEGGAEGMIVTDGGRFGGYGLFLSKGECRPRPRPRGVHLQPARPEADDVGGPLPGAGQAHHRLRLQDRRARPRQGRHRRSVGRWHGGGDQHAGARHADHCSPRTRTSTSDWTPAPAWRRWSIATTCRSGSPARSTS